MAQPTGVGGVERSEAEWIGRFRSQVEGGAAAAASTWGLGRSFLTSYQEQLCNSVCDEIVLWSEASPRFLTFFQESTT